MFFIQQQLSENTCGHWTEVTAYFYLTHHLTKHRLNRSLISIPHQIKLK